MEALFQQIAGVRVVVPGQLSPATLAQQLPRIACFLPHEFHPTVFEDGNGSKPRREEAEIKIYYDSRPFKFETIMNSYDSATGWEGPERLQIGEHSFYYFGAGGGGVSYPDRYIYNLNGHILVIDFDGPYTNDKTPPEETKQMEREMLQSLNVRTARPVKYPRITSIAVEGPQVVICGAYLAKVEVWAIPSGSDTIEEDYALIGTAMRIGRAGSRETWTDLIDCENVLYFGNLPTFDQVPTIFAKVLDSYGHEINFKSLSKRQSFELVKARCEKRGHP